MIGVAPTRDESIGVIGRKVKALRRRTVMSQSTLAHLVGVTAQTIMRLEQGKRCPHQITVHRLATALGTTVDELLEGADRESLWR